MDDKKRLEEIARRVWALDKSLRDSELEHQRRVTQLENEAKHVTDGAKRAFEDMVRDVREKLSTILAEQELAKAERLKRAGAEEQQAKILKVEDDDLTKMVKRAELRQKRTVVIATILVPLASLVTASIQSHCK